MEGVQSPVYEMQFAYQQGAVLDPGRASLEQAIVSVDTVKKRADGVRVSEGERTIFPCGPLESSR